MEPETSGRTHVTPAREAADGRSDADVSAVRASLGQTIKTLRQAKDWSTRDLASATNVTPGFISQLENGKTMPSVAKLLSLAAALDVLVGDLFQAPIGKQRVIRKNERPSFDYPSLGLRDELLSSDQTKKLEVLLGHVEPGRGSGPELYTHGSEAEFILVLEGTLEVFIESETYVLEEGDSITFAGDSPHGYTNPGEVTTRAIWVYTPASY